MDKRLVVKQNGQNDCAVACTISIMRYYNVYPLYEEVSYLLKVDKAGTNALNIINGIKSFGFDGYGIHYTYEEIINRKVKYPIICHTIKNNMYHFIVVYGVNDKYVKIMDPSSNINKILKSEFKKIYLGTSLIIFPVKIINRFTKHQSLYKFIFDFLNIKDIIKIIVLSFIVIVLSLLTNYYLKIYIDNKNSYFYLITYLFLIIVFFKNIINYIRQKIIIKIENNLNSNINISIFRKLFNLPYLFFKNKSIGEIESRLNDLSSFREFFNKIIVDGIINIIFVLCSFIILLSINYKLLLICLIEIIIYYFIVFLFKYSNYIKIEDELISKSDYKKCLYESIAGYETNRNINYINELVKKIEIKYLSYNNKNRILQNLINKELLFKNIVSDSMYIILLFISICFVNKGNITLGDLVLFNSILYYFKEPIKYMIDMNQDLIYLKSVYKRINDLFVIDNKQETFRNINIDGDIIINHLSYSVDGISNIFDNVNINIKNKSKFLIYGKSGSGKSTIMKILLKYLDNYEGKIYLNGINLKDISNYVISSNFTYVSQNSYLNNDTLINNIIFDRNIDNNKYEEIINLCNLNEFRDKKELRNNFIIEDNGFNISGGERQKIILARSLLKESNFIILDEALSEVDLKEEIQIIKKIFNKFKDKTIIYISHKEELISLFDLKYKLERSEV